MRSCKGMRRSSRREKGRIWRAQLNSARMMVTDTDGKENEIQTTRTTITRDETRWEARAPVRSSKVASRTVSQRFTRFVCEIAKRNEDVRPVWRQERMESSDALQIEPPFASRCRCRQDRCAHRSNSTVAASFLSKCSDWGSLLLAARAETTALCLKAQNNYIVATRLSRPKPCPINACITLVRLKPHAEEWEWFFEKGNIL